MNFLLAISIACFHLALARDISPWVKVENALQSRNETVQTILELMSKPQILDRYWTKFCARNRADFNGVGKPVLRFSWSNCGSPSDSVIVNSISVSPDPIVVPGIVTVSFDAILKVNVTAPLQVNVEAQKKVAIFWVDVPCVDNIGSCNYRNACALIPVPCPEAIVKAGLPCKCPIPASHYHIPPTAFQIPNIPLPAFIEDGDFKATVKGSMGGKSIFCYNVEFSIEKKP